MADGNPKIKVTTLSEQDCRRWIEQLVGVPRARGTGSTRGRFAKFHDAIRVRDQHFHNDPAVGPKFKAPFDKAQVFQSDRIRATWAEAKIRLVEHPFRPHVNPPRDTQTMRDAANALETVLREGLEQGQRRRRVSIASALGDGQMLHGVAFLTWGLVSDLWPKYEPEQIDELPDESDPEERARFREYDPDVDGPDEEPEDDQARASYRPRKKYRETEQALSERMRAARANAFPIVWDVLRADQCGYVEDVSPLNGFAIFVTVRQIGMMDYKQGLKADGLAVSLLEGTKKLRVYEEVERPAVDDPSQDKESWGPELRVGHVWTRDECYELVSLPGTNDWTLVKSWQHGYGMPPFAAAYADRENHPDPLYALQPWLQGMFRTKPDFDYERSLGRILIEQVALRRYWIELSEGGFMEDGRGSRVVLSENDLNSFALPPGAKLVSADQRLHPAFVQFLDMSRQELMDATPQTGKVDIEATTAPHTAVQSLAQANSPIAFLKARQAEAVEIMLRSWVHCMMLPADKGGIGDIVEVYGSKDDERKLVGVEPRLLEGMDVTVTVLPASGAQQIATSEYYRGVLADPHVPFGMRDYLEVTGDENPDATISSWLAERVELAIAEQSVKEEQQRRLSGVFSVAAGGLIQDGTGTMREPQDVLREAGYRPAQAAPPPGTPPGVVTPGPIPPPMGNLEPMQGVGPDMIPPGVPM